MACTAWKSTTTPSTPVGAEVPAEEADQHQRLLAVQEELHDTLRGQRRLDQAGWVADGEAPQELRGSRGRMASRASLLAEVGDHRFAHGLAAAGPLGVPCRRSPSAATPRWSAAAGPRPSAGGWPRIEGRVDVGQRPVQGGRGRVPRRRPPAISASLSGNARKIVPSAMPTASAIWRVVTISPCSTSRARVARTMTARRSSGGGRRPAAHGGVVHRGPLYE